MTAGSNSQAMADGGGKPLSRSRKSVKKRDEIVRAATAIINKKSYALATMTEIAAALDLRDATLYYYFPNKRALAYACHRRSLERFERLLGEATKMEATGADRLEHFIRSLLETSAREGTELYFGDYSYLDTTQRKAIGDWASRLTGQFEQMIEGGIADRSIVACEAGMVVHLLLGMMIWLGKWTPSVEGLTVERLMDAIGVTVFRGIRR